MKKRYQPLRYAAALTFIAAVIAGCSPEPGATAGDPDEQFLDKAREHAAAAPSNQDGRGALMPDGGAVPKIELETDTFEMGEIANTGVTTKRMPVYNRGDARLVIADVKTSCGCTTAEMERQVIAPGEEADLIIHVNPKRIAGFYADRVLTLFTNDPRNPHPRVHVISRVKPEVAITPEAFDFGQVSAGHEAEMTIHVRQLEDAAFEIRDVTTGGRLSFIETNFEKLPEKEWANPDKAEYRVTARILAGAPPGVIEDSVTLRTNLKRSPNVPVRLDANVVRR